MRLGRVNVIAQGAARVIDIEKELSYFDQGFTPCSQGVVVNIGRLV